MRVKRRVPLAVAASLGLHILAGGLVVGSSLWGAFSRVPIDVEITGTRLEDLQDLPLGLPMAGDSRSKAAMVPAPTAPPLVAAPPADRGSRASKAKREKGPESPETETEASAAPPRPSSVRSYAPEGSRVTALLRLDRLRGSSYAPAVDALLVHLPDRRDLLEGTGIDLYRDIDALLVATPNPVDATVTFLAARHRLSDRALRVALDRGARETGRKLDWRTERGRPFAERRSSTVEVAGGRDQRLILLAAPHLVVVAPPAYRSLILRGRGAGSGATHRAPDGGAPDAGGAPANGVASTPDAGVDGGGRAPVADDGTGWAALLRRIDAEDSILPPDAVAMVSAVDLFTARTVRSTLDVAPGTRGAVDDVAPPAATAFGMPVPKILTATLGILPQPFADVLGEFSAERDSTRWEQEWPGLRHKLLANPLVVLSGFSGLVARATITRTGLSIHLRVDATEEETTRLLLLAGARLPALGR